MFKAIKKVFGLILKSSSFLLILFVLFANNVLRAQEAEKKFIGFIDSLEGSVNKEDVDDLIKLNAFDQVFTNDKIKIGPNSSIVVSFIDNSILTLQSDSEFLVEKFDKISEEPSFIIAITKGKFAFESGTIAKNDKGIMKIKLGEMEIDLKGTAITGAISDADGETTIALVEDTMKKVGEIIVTAGDETIVITEAHAGLKLSEDKPMETTTMSEEEIIEAADAMSKAVVQASTIDPKKIERAIMKQLAEGKSGLTNLADVETLLAEISSFQDDKREAIVEASGEDVSILSEIIVNSESDQSLQMMEGLMENNAESATLLMTEIVEQDFDIFSHVAKAEIGNFEELRKTIVSEMIQDESDFVADTMAQMMAVSDASMSSYMINEIANIEATDAGANLAMDVLTTFTEVASEKMTEFFQDDPNMMDALTTNAFENATEDDVGIISDMMQEAAGESTAYLMASMVEHKAEMIGDIYKNLAEQDFDLFHHIEQPTKKRTQAEKEADRALKREERAERKEEEEEFMSDPESMMDDQEQFVDNLKGDIFSEIINHSEGTTADVTTDLMMNSRGDSAMFMMEIIIEDNPELVADVMQNFIEEDFDIFEHFEETYEEEPTIVETEGKAEATAAPEEKRKLTKEERQTEKIEKKAEKERAREEKKIAKQERKEAKALEKQLKKEEKKLAKLLNLPEPEEEFEDPIFDTGLDIDEDPESSSAIYDIKTDIIGEMFQHGGASTVAAMITKSDNIEDSVLLLDIVNEQIAISSEDGNLSETQDFMDEVVEYMAEESPDFMDEVVEHMAEESPTTLLVMSEENRDLYEGIVKDRSDEGLSSEDLVKEIEDSEGANQDLGDEQVEEYYADELGQEDFIDEGEQEEEYFTDELEEEEDFIDEDEQQEEDYAYLYEYEELTKKEAKAAEREAKKVAKAETKAAEKEAKQAAKKAEKQANKLAEEYAAYLFTLQEVTAPTWGAYYTTLTDRELGSISLPYQYLYAEKGNNNTDLEFISSDLTNLGLSLTTAQDMDYASIAGTLPAAGDYDFDVFVRDSVKQAKVSPILKFYFTVDVPETTWSVPSNPGTIYNLGELRFGFDPYYDSMMDDEWSDGYTSFYQSLEASSGPSAQVNYRYSPAQVKEFAYHPANDLPLGLTIESSAGMGSIESSEIEEVLAADTDFTFTVRAEETGTEAPRDEQGNLSDFNDRNFRVTILADPRCVSPAQYDCPL